MSHPSIHPSTTEVSVCHGRRGTCAVQRPWHQPREQASSVSSHLPIHVHARIANTGHLFVLTNPLHIERTHTRAHVHARPATGRRAPAFMSMTSQRPSDVQASPSLGESHTKKANAHYRVDQLSGLYQQRFKVTKNTHQAKDVHYCSQCSVAQRHI